MRYQSCSIDNFLSLLSSDDSLCFLPLPAPSPLQCNFRFLQGRRAVNLRIYFSKSILLFISLFSVWGGVGVGWGWGSGILLLKKFENQMSKAFLQCSWSSRVTLGACE